MTTRRINASSNIDFTGSNYKIAKWTPAITRRDSSPLSLPFADVVETVEVEVTGSTATDAYDKAADMAAMLDEVTDFRNGDASAVTFDYEPPGAANGVQQALITRYLGINYPTANDIESGANQGVIAPVTIQFERRGLWLEDADDSTTVSANAAFDTVLTRTHSASHATRCPVAVYITSADFTSTNTTARSFDGCLFISNDADNIGVLTGSDWSGAANGNWTLGSSGISYSSSSTSVLKFSGSSASTTNEISLSGLINSSARLVAYAVACAPTGSFTLSFSARSGAYATASVSSDSVHIDSTTPKVYRIGTFALDGGVASFSVTGTPLGGAATAEIDRIIFMVESDESYVLKTSAQNADSGLSPTQTFSFALEHNALSALVAQWGYYTTSSGAHLALAYDGNPNVYLSGDEVAVHWAAVEGGNWNVALDGAITDIKLQTKRRLARVIAT